MKQFKSVKFFLFAIVMILVLTACQDNSDNTSGNQSSDGQESSGERVSDESIGVTDDTIKIGAHIGVSGPVALIATEMRNGWNAALHEINKEGIHGRKLELIVEDDEYAPAKAVGSVRKLVDRDKVFAVTGGGTPTVMAVLDYLTEKEIPYLFPYAGQHERLNSLAGKEDGAPYLFMTHPDYATQYYNLTNYIIEEKGIDKIALLYQNDDAGADMIIGLTRALNDKGLEPLVLEGFEANATDFTAQIQKARNAGAEAIALGTTIRPGALIVEQADAMGYNPQYFAHATFADNNFLDLLGPLAEGIVGAYFLIPEDDDGEEMQRYLNALEEVAPGADPTFFSMYGYTTLMSLADALEEVGESPTREKLIEVIKKWDNKETELMGTLSFSGDDFDGKKSIYPIEVIDGKWTQVGDWIDLPEEVKFLEQ